jgi:hypothetical protein
MKKIDFRQKQYSVYQPIVDSMMADVNSEAPVFEFVRVYKTFDKSLIEQVCLIRNPDLTENTYLLYYFSEYNTPDSGNFGKEVLYNDNHFALEGVYEKKVRNFTYAESEKYLDSLGEIYKCVDDFAILS